MGLFYVLFCFVPDILPRDFRQTHLQTISWKLRGQIKRSKKQLQVILLPIVTILKKQSSISAACSYITVSLTQREKLSVLKSVFFILKEKIFKQASYVNVKVMGKNSKRATVLQSLLVVIMLLLSQQPKKIFFKPFDWLHTHCTWSNWTRAASAVPSANERWARDALSPRGRLQCLSSSGRAASESWHLQGEGEDAKRITSYTRYDLITCGKPLSYHGVIKKKAFYAACGEGNKI